MPPKTGHHRAKNVDFDDEDVYSDEYYEEEEGDGMTDEDREQLRLGVVKVREALGETLGETLGEEQIRESLWFYYFDVQKTVAYLRGKYETKPASKPASKPTQTPDSETKKQKPISRFDQAANAAGIETKSTAGAKPKSGQAKKANGQKLAESMEKLAVEEAPKVKSKNLNVLEEYNKSGMKRMANFVVIGHVDHGKSTLMGRLLYDLKVIDPRSLEKLRKEATNIGKSSFALAWVMDQTTEERTRGVTVDIATTHFSTPTTRFTILDAPGHQDFIPNMIAGAAQADFAVLVIDAGINGFESGLRGQTKEHALLVRSMGVQRVVVAVNKMDTISWSQHRFTEIQQQMTTFLTSASFSAKNIAFIPCAGLTGENVTSPPTEAKAEWYKGQTLIEALEASEPGSRNIASPLRMTVADVFRGGVTYPLSISGRIDAGALQVGDVVMAMPAGERAVVKGVEVEGGGVEWGVAGQICTLHLADIDPIHLRLGDIVCDTERPVGLREGFVAKILAFEHVLPGTVDVFRGRLQAEGVVSELLAKLDKGGEATGKKPRILKPGDLARVKVGLSVKLPLEKGDRVVLREGGVTVGAGIVE